MIISISLFLDSFVCFSDQKQTININRCLKMLFVFVNLKMIWEEWQTEPHFTGDLFVRFFFLFQSIDAEHIK